MALFQCYGIASAQGWNDLERQHPRCIGFWYCQPAGKSDRFSVFVTFGKFIRLEDDRGTLLKREAIPGIPDDGDAALARGERFLFDHRLPRFTTVPKFIREAFGQVAVYGTELVIESSDLPRHIKTCEHLMSDAT